MIATLLAMQKNLQFPLKVGASYIIRVGDTLTKGVLQSVDKDSNCPYSFHVNKEKHVLDSGDIFMEFSPLNSKVFDAFHYTTFEVGNINDMANAFLKLSASVPYALFEKISNEINTLVSDNKVSKSDVGILFITNDDSSKNSLFYYETPAFKIDNTNFIRVGFVKK